MSMPIQRLFYRVEEVATLLEISVRTAYRAIEKGDIPSTRVRGSLRIPIAEFHIRFGLSGTVASTSTDRCADLSWMTKKRKA